MTIASVSRITASSPHGFQDALKRGLERARQTLRGITALEVVSERARVEEGKIRDYVVELKVVFELEG
jgi:flavin-binding protein dodecin